MVLLGPTQRLHPVDSLANNSCRGPREALLAGIDFFLAGEISATAELS